MENQKNCDHGKSYERNGKYWKCQICGLDILPEEVERILVSKRQGFEEDTDSAVFDAKIAPKSDLKQ